MVSPDSLSAMAKVKSLYGAVPMAPELAARLVTELRNSVAQCCAVRRSELTTPLSLAGDKCSATALHSTVKLLSTTLLVTHWQSQSMRTAALGWRNLPVKFTQYAQIVPRLTCIPGIQNAVLHLTAVQSLHQAEPEACEETQAVRRVSQVERQRACDRRGRKRGRSSFFTLGHGEQAVVPNEQKCLTNVAPRP